MVKRLCKFTPGVGKGSAKDILVYLLLHIWTQRDRNLPRYVRSCGDTLQEGYNIDL